MKKDVFTSLLQQEKIGNRCEKEFDSLGTDFDEGRSTSATVVLRFLHVKLALDYLLTIAK